jgi:hypothetical protein
MNIILIFGFHNHLIYRVDISKENKKMTQTALCIGKSSTFLQWKHYNRSDVVHCNNYSIIQVLFYLYYDHFFYLIFFLFKIFNFLL